MEADWEVEIGGGAPVIDALWPGFVDLRRYPDRIGEIPEACASSPLAFLLTALNAVQSPLWTAKCDLWVPEGVDLTVPQLTEPDPAATVTPAKAAIACYIDILPVDGVVFPTWEQAEGFCRDWVARLAGISIPGSTADLIVRQAVAGDLDGFGVTAYLSVEGIDWLAVIETFADTLVAFADALPPDGVSASSK
jgi:hypothetical protein